MDAQNSISVNVRALCHDNRFGSSDLWDVTAIYLSEENEYNLLVKLGNHVCASAKLLFNVSSERDGKMNQ